MSFKPIQKLNVVRTLHSGKQVVVGVLAQTRHGFFFNKTLTQGKQENSALFV